VREIVEASMLLPEMLDVVVFNANKNALLKFFPFWRF